MNILSLRECFQYWYYLNKKQPNLTIKYKIFDFVFEKLNSFFLREENLQFRTLNELINNILYLEKRNSLTVFNKIKNDIIKILIKQLFPHNNITNKLIKFRDLEMLFLFAGITKIDFKTSYQIDKYILEVKDYEEMIYNKYYVVFISGGEYDKFKDKEEIIK